MPEFFKMTMEIISMSLEAVACLLILMGAMGALYRLFVTGIKESRRHYVLRSVWLVYARWILLGLEFTIGADIIRTIAAPNWDSIGQLASIALIRTFLSFFLERDLELARKNHNGDQVP